MSFMNCGYPNSTSNSTSNTNSCDKHYLIEIVKDRIIFRKKMLRSSRLLTLLHLVCVLSFVILLFTNANMVLAISQIVIWSFNLIIDYFTIKRSKISLNESYTEYYEKLKKYDNETYVKVMREKKLKRVTT